MILGELNGKLGKNKKKERKNSLNEDRRQINWGYSKIMGIMTYLYT